MLFRSAHGDGAAHGDDVTVLEGAGLAFGGRVLVEARELLPFASLQNLEQVFTVRFTKIQLKM